MGRFQFNLKTAEGRAVALIYRQSLSRHKNERVTERIRGHITHTQSCAAKLGENIGKSICDKYIGSVAYKGKLYCKCLYNVEGLPLSHWRPYVRREVNFADICSVIDGYFVLDVGMNVWNRIRNGLKMGHTKNVYFELSNFFTREGMEEFFPEILKQYDNLYNPETLARLEEQVTLDHALSNISELETSSQVNRDVRLAKLHKSDQDEICNHSARHLCRVGDI